MENITYRTVQGLSFCVYTKEEIQKFSVLEITNPNTFDALGHPTVASLYDPSLGPNERDEFCTSCGLNYFKCPGHIGHISLPLPVYNPVFLPRLYQLLRGSCFYCHRIVAPPVPLYLTLYQLRALDHGFVSLVQDLEEAVSDAFSENLSAKESLNLVQEKLKSKFDEAVKGISSEEHGKQPALVKSVVDCRRIIVKKFIREQMMGAKGKCPYCKGVKVKMTLRHNTTIVMGGRKKLDFNALKEEEDGDIKVIDKISEQVGNEELTPLEAKKHLHLLWDNDQVFLQHLYKTLCAENSSQEHPTDMFFMDLLVVPPIKFRRLMVVKSRKFLNPQSAAYNEVLKDSLFIKNLMKAMRNMTLDPAEQDIINKMRGKSNEEKLHHKWIELQRHVNEIFDSESNKLDKAKTPFGIKQILEKKEGLFRKNMMGKRVNYAARSVISPDPYIMVNEIGVPMVFAKKLTFPEPVSHWNVEKLRLAVNNGPDVHPGAVLVESEDGRISKLSNTDASSRRMIANTLLTPPASGSKGYIGVKKVHRHLRNGDMLLLNRQPTLHKPSIMAHKARVLPGEKTLRLHYANCKSYNADFDGDEMNAHFPQSLHGQAEAQNIVGVNHQYLVPKDGTPLSGLIQDHIIAATLLTIRGRFFSRDDYHQLMYSAISFKKTRLKLLPPAIIKPKVLWSGKQIVSSIIINLIPEGKPPPSVEGKTKVSSKNWQTVPARKWKAGGSPLKGDCMSESEVVISAGELLCGVIDKAQIGPTPYSLIHCCYELYGGETSSLLLTALARLFTHYLQLHSGFSLGIEDIMITEEATAKREEIMTHSDKEGESATCAAFEINPADMPMARKQLLYNYREAHYNRDDSGLKVLDFEMKKVTDKLNNEINDVCIPDGLIKKFPKNSLQLMVQSGAKGSSVNAMQITCLLGQIELEGRRMPLMMNGCSLPSFLPYDSSPGAGGFVMGRFLTGINHQEYFFHCMAGREGLIDTAVKTSRSGYLQRCLIKHLEGIMVNYDLTVRDSDGSVIQFLYGEDGLDVSKNQLLKENRLHLLVKNYDAAMNEEEVASFKSRQTEEDPEVYKKKIKKWTKKNGSSEKKRQSPFLLYELKNAVEEVLGIQQKKKHLCSGWIDLDKLEKKKLQKKIKKCPYPVNSFLRPNLSFGSVSEQLESIITDYMKKNPQGLLCADADAEYYAYNKTQKYLPKSKFQSMAYYRAMRALAEPGEAVGLLCAQSIGEPSTQMTLNTFHFAGKGEMNVTLGIPRLREILMTASANIATPTMDLPLLDVPDVETKAEKLRVKLAPVTLKELLEAVEITEKISIKRKIGNHRSYNIKMNFLKHSEYKGVINVTPKKILYFIEHTFIKKVIESLMKKLRLKSSSVFVSASKANEQSLTFAESRDEDDPAATNDPRKNDKESSDESDGDGDTVSMKSKNRHEQEQEYEDPEDDEKLPESDAENSDQECDIQIKEEVKSEDEYAENIVSHQTREVFENENVKQCRIADVKSVHSWISYYDFDVKHERWCEFTLQMNLEGSKLDLKTLLEDEINKTFVYQVSHIQEALLVKNPKELGKMMLKTKGVNFLEIFRYDNILDINKVYSNNIHSISLTYGIEAAARAIVHEIRNVFALYGIEVDPRHLSLLADYMTSTGIYQACNRMGMESNASPLQQMTFETTKNYMVEAMLMGSEDNLKSPSANIIVGQLVGTGTGCFSLSSGRMNS